MVGSFGAGFGTLLFGAAILALAALIAFTLLLTLIATTTGTNLDLLYYTTTALVVVILLTTAFAILALIDEAPPAAVLFLVTVLLPLLMAGIRLYTPHRSLLAVITLAAFAWSLPFIGGTALLYLIVATIDLSTPILAAIIATTITAGTLYLADELTTRLPL